MLVTFINTLNPMLMLFIFMAVGFTLRKLGVLPESSGKVMAKLETWVFCPALSFYTMAKNCNVRTIAAHGKNVLFGCFAILLAVTVATLLSYLFVRKRSENEPPELTAERGVFAYSLAIANGSYVGDPLIQAIFGDVMLSYYKFFYMPVSIVIYTWGMSMLVPSESGKSGGVSDFIKKILNPPTVALFLGMIFGLTGLGEILESAAPPVMSALVQLKACMGPVAMLLAGFTVAGYSIPDMLKNKKVYFASALRLIVIPAALIGALFGLKELLRITLGIETDNTVLFLAYFAFAAPLGLNTVIFPEAYGGDPKLGASMTLISSVLCVLTIPLTYTLMTVLFGVPSV